MIFISIFFSVVRIVQKYLYTPPTNYISIIVKFSYSYKNLNITQVITADCLINFASPETLQQLHISITQFIIIYDIKKLPEQIHFRNIF